MCYHKQNLGVDNFDEFKNILINLIADGLTRDEKSSAKYSALKDFGILEIIPLKL